MSRINKFEQEKHQLVEQLVRRLLAINNEGQKTSFINEIVVTILRSRPICHRFKGMPLTGVYQGIYLQAKEQLIHHLKMQINSAQSTQKSGIKIVLQSLSAVYLYKLQTQIFLKNLDDQQLKDMGLAAQNFSLNSELRTYALTELVKAIKFSGRLCRPHRSKFSPDLYQRLYDEAIAETFGYICLNIDLYDPNRGDKKFMNWVNYKLDKSLLKCYGQYHKYAKFEIPSSQNLEQIVQVAAAPDLTEILREYIIRDPDQIFSTTHIRNRPDANFTQVALAKFSGQSWEQISRKLDIPIPTLSSFYNRWCRRFTPLIDTELKQYF
ncbi:MAG: hypothetical protein RLZZ74_1824 [Cyanobacteriota bacterium]